MSIETSIKIEDPDDVKISMTITLSLNEWKILKTQLTIPDQRYPGWDLERQISNLIEKIQQKIFDKTEEDDSQE